MQKHVNLVDLVKSFPTNILLQNLASIQKRTSPIKFAHLAEESEKGSISNLSTKVGGVGKRCLSSGGRSAGGSAARSAQRGARENARGPPRPRRPASQRPCRSATAAPGP